MTDFESSLLYFRKSLSIRREFKDNSLIASGLINIATVLQRLKRYSESNSNAEEALEYAKEANEIKILMRCYGIMAENYEKLGNQHKSLEYMTLYSSLKGHIQQKELAEIKQEKQKTQQEASQARTKLEKIEKEKSTNELALKFTTKDLTETRRLSMKQRKALTVKELMLKQQEETLAKRNVTIIFSLVVIVFIGLFALMIFFSYRMKKKSSETLSAQNKEIIAQQEIIKKKNLDIMKSINYAQRIQQSMLPTIDDLRELMPESFIYFRPRDVVSGDFYWFTRTQNKEFIFKKTRPVVSKDDSFLIAAVDCTGHGVPGAFMSMIGYNLLDEIVSVGIVEPNEVLDALHL
jgi:cbb3-type cytochrome oxidase subunit 3